MKHANAFVKLVEECMPRIKEISCGEVMSALSLWERGGGSRGEGLSSHKSPHPNPLPRGEGIILIDVREDGEWAAGFIPGAKHLGRGVIERDIEQAIPNRDTKIVLYCGGGYRSALAADSLQKMGYTNVYSMAGGWREWCEAGFIKE